MLEELDLDLRHPVVPASQVALRYYTNASILPVKIIVCSKLLYRKVYRLKPFSYLRTARVSSTLTFETQSYLPVGLLHQQLAVYFHLHQQSSRQLLLTLLVSCQSSPPRAVTDSLPCFFFFFITLEPRVE